MTGRATEALLDSLHGLVAESLRDELKAAVARSRDPENPEPLNPQLIDKVLKFLKDNGVASPKGTPKVDALAGELADLDLDAEVLGNNRRH